MLQNVAGKRIGFIDNRIAAPNSPGDKLQPLSFQRKTQQRMTQADRRTEIARPYSADAVDALPPAFDLRSQPPRQEKAEQRRMRPRMVGDQVSFFPGPAHNLRMPLGALSHYKKGGFYILFPQQVEKPGR